MSSRAKDVLCMGKRYQSDELRKYGSTAGDSVELRACRSMALLATTMVQWCIKHVIPFKLNAVKLPPNPAPFKRTLATILCKLYRAVTLDSNILQQEWKICRKPGALASLFHLRLCSSIGHPWLLPYVAAESAMRYR